MLEITLNQSYSKISGNIKNFHAPAVTNEGLRNGRGSKGQSQQRKNNKIEDMKDTTFCFVDGDRATINKWSQKIKKLVAEANKKNELLQQ